MMRKITKDEVIVEMKRVYVENNDNVPTIKEWDAIANISADVVRRVFGKYTSAWVEIGIDNIDPVYKKREEIIINLQRAFANSPNVTCGTELVRAAGHTVPTVMKYFDSISHAMSSARLSIDKKINNDKFIEDFKNIYATVNRYPTAKDIREHGKFAFMTYMRRFGSIDNIAKAAGVDKPELKIGTSDNEMLNDLKGIYERTGNVPTNSDIYNMSKYSADMFRKKFGTLEVALGKIGLKKTGKRGPAPICKCCGGSFRKIIEHMKAKHVGYLNEHNELVIKLYKGGLSSKKIANMDDIIYNKAQYINDIIRVHLTPDEIEVLRKQKIKKTLKDKYESGECDWIKDINTARNTSAAGKLSNSTGLKKSYADNNRKAWNDGLTKDTDKRIAKSAEKISESIRDMYDTGEIEKKVGPANALWKEDRSSITRRYRLGLGFGSAERGNIKKRAGYMCQKCGISQELLEDIGKTLECDHIIPIHAGGLKDWEGNGQALCPKCHQDKTNNDASE